MSSIVSAVADYGDDGYTQDDALTKIDPTEILESKASVKAQEVAMQQMSGQIPDDVLENLRTRAAEKGITQGLGVGGSTGALTLRDFGVNQLEYVQQGIATAGAFEEMNIGRQQQQEALRQSAISTNNTQTLQLDELNQKWAQTMTTSGLAEGELSQSMLALQSANRNYLGSLENQLLIANAQYEIGDMQANLSALGGTDDQPGYFEQMNQSAQSWIDLLSGV